MDINNSKSTSLKIGNYMNLLNQCKNEILTIILKYEDNFIKDRNKLIGVGCPTASLITSFNINQSEQIRLQNIETEDFELIDFIVDLTNKFRKSIIKENEDVIKNLKEYGEKAKKKNQNAMQHEEDNTIDPSTQDLFSIRNQIQASIKKSSQFIPTVSSTIANQEYFRPSALAVNENTFNSTVNNENEKSNETVVFKKPAAKSAAKPSKNLKNIINKQVEYFMCDIDGQIFTSKINFCNHMNNHLKVIDNNFQCQICSKMFKSAQRLRQHEKIHDKKFQCEICKSMQPTKGQLNKHIKLYHQNTETYKCEKCSKEFKQKHHLADHQKTHDKNRPKPFKCHRCDFATDTKHSFNNHKKVHERQDKKFAAMKNPIKCEKCPTFHRNKRSLKQHMRKVHPKVQFQCDLCAKYFKIKPHIEGHMKIHIRK